MSGTREADGFVSVSSEAIESNTLESISAGLHSLRMAPFEFTKLWKIFVVKFPFSDLKREQKGQLFLKEEHIPAVRRDMRTADCPLPSCSTF